ncbi:hypothetical protein [Streptomyces sp. NPDC046909]|uniref:hypothetical protein n=1 Tax=Streptomyces sp. NPDC046909 TaxID=3155617 RepID=UPI0033D150E8
MTDPHGCAFDGCCPRRNTGVRLIDPRMPELARCLTLFRYVQAVTGGPVARIDQAGSYAVPTLRGEPFAVRPGTITLRLDAERVSTAVVAREEGSVLVRLLDGEGRTAHEGRLLSDGDRLLAGLARTVEAGAVPGEASRARATPDEEASRAPEASDGEAGSPARGTGTPVGGSAPVWEYGDQLAQLDAVLADGGVARRAAFGRYRGEHREVEAGLVSAVLDHVCSVGLPIGVAVFAPAAMQACAGRVHVTDRTVGGRVFAALADSSVEIDLADVRACHLVRSTAAHGPTSALELDDADGRCVAVLTQFGIVGEQVHRAWEDLTASLPDA